MKKDICLIILFFTILAMASCEKIDLTAEDDTNNSLPENLKSLTIKTRSVSTALSYPIRLYAFDVNGKCQAETTIENENKDQATLSLPKGLFHITAIHTPSEYPSIEKNDESEMIVCMPTAKYATQPFLSGSADVLISSANQSTNITMGYRQAHLSVSLSDIPADIKEVKLSIGSPYTKMYFTGDYSSSDIVTIPCVKNAGKWETGDFYIMPTENALPVLTISMLSADNQETSYSYTFNQPLTAATPYTFNGSYIASNNTTTLETNINIGNWNTALNQDFTFGPGITTENDEQGIYVTEFPEDGEMWGGHVVALADVSEDGNTCEVMLISMQEWIEVESANVENSTQAVSTAKEYQEEDLTDWKIPTKEEVLRLRSVYSYEDNFKILNSVLSSCGAVPLSMTNGSTDTRYLCDEGKSSFCFKRGTQISTAGTQKLYNMRLIKILTLVKK